MIQTAKSFSIPVIVKIDFNLSDRCNLKCSFCYANGGCGNSYNQEHIDKTFNWFWKQFLEKATPEQITKGLHVNIYGGEPLVEWMHLKEMVEAQTKRAQEYNSKISFGITTNMTLLDEEKLNWCISHKIGIGSSIDGCQPAQDAERKYADGSGSSSVVYENARRLVVKARKTGSRMTITPNTVQYLYESILHVAKNLGFTNIAAVLASGVEWSDEKLEIYQQQLSKVTDWWIDEMRHGRHISLNHLRVPFNNLWNGQRRRTLCGAGRAMVGIDTEGNIYPCHRFLNLSSKPEYLLGTLDTGITNTDLMKKLMSFNLPLVMAERCKDCPAVLVCPGMCIHEMMMAGKGMFEPLEYSCKAIRIGWKMGLRAHSIMMAEHNKLYLQNYEPKTIKALKDKQLQEKQIKEKQLKEKQLKDSQK